MEKPRTPSARPSRAGSGSTWCRHSLYHTISLRCASVVLPTVAGGHPSSPAPSLHGGQRRAGPISGLRGGPELACDGGRWFELRQDRL
jgi:hypothetical protein